jgi:hypothetical protein
MPSQQLKQAPTQTTSGPAVAANNAANEQKYGNAAQQEKVGGGAGGDAGLASYEAALGDFLGGELYEAVSGALAFDKFSKMAHGAVDGALKAAVQAAGGWEKLKADPKALDALAEHLGQRADPLVDKWLAEDGKELQEKLAKWAGAHPRTVATVALLAAAGAVIANIDLPTLKQKFSIGKDTKGEIEAELGKIRSLALEKVRAKITHASGPLLAAVEVAHTNGKTEGSGELKLGKDDGNHLAVDGKFDDDGLKVAGLKGVLQTDAGKLAGGVSSERGKEGPLASLTLEQKDGNTTLTSGFWYDAGTGVLTLGRDAVADLGGGVTAKQTVRGGSDGSGSMSTGLAYKADGLEASAGFSAKQGAYGLTEEQKLQLGLKYDRDGLKASFDADLASASNANRARLKGSVEKDFGDGHKAGGTLDASLGGDKDLLELGAFYGFKDPNSFNAWLVEYKYNSKLDDNQFKGMLQSTLGPVKMRYQGAMQWGGNGRNVDLAAHGAYFFDKDTAAIAGVGYRHDLDAGTGSLKPEVGIQHKGVQVLFGYDTQNKAGTIRLGIPF